MPGFIVAMHIQITQRQDVSAVKVQISKVFVGVLKERNGCRRFPHFEKRYASQLYRFFVIRILSNCLLEVIVSIFESAFKDVLQL